MVYRISFFLSICFLFFQSTIAQSPLNIDINLIKNPGIEYLINSVDNQLDVGIGLKYFRSPRESQKKSNRDYVLVDPVGWPKFCFFSGYAFGAVNENYARTGSVFMRLEIYWIMRQNRVNPGNISATLYHPLEPGCNYRFGIWVARSPDDPERINNVTLRIKGIQGKVRSLEYSPEDSAYLEFQIPLDEMEVGEYRYYEGDFTALSNDDHLYLEVNTDEFVVGRKARRIQRRCSRMPSGCGGVQLASIIFDDVSLVDISGCNEDLFKVPVEQPEKVKEAYEFITLSRSFSDWVQVNTASFYFHHDQPNLDSEELERFRFFLKKLDGRIESIHAYTDSTGSITYNQELSSLRASYISEQLQKMDIHDQPKVMGNGECTHVSCTTLEHCRRVEVIWKPNLQGWNKNSDK